jgi:hypothetical protein
MAAKAAEKLVPTAQGDVTPKHNRPPLTAQIVADEVAETYKGLATATSLLLASAKALPTVVETESDVGKIVGAVKELRTTYDLAESNRKSEKDPYFRAGQAVDAFFNGIKDRLEKAEEILTKRVHAYNQRKLQAEREAREAAQREANRIAKEAADKLAEEQRLANEAAQAAARARKPENIEAHEQRAEQHEDAASEARVDALIANDNAESARLAAMAKPAEMVRERFDTGMSTMAQVGYVEILDRDKLDMKALWPHLKEDHILAALKLWAKSGSYKKPMEGAIVEMRDSTKIL